MAKLIRYTGHSFKKTAYGYVFDEENIGLTSELKGKKDIFDRIVRKKSQTLLEEFKKKSKENMKRINQSNV